MKSNRSYLDHQREIDTYYDVPLTFSEAFVPGAVVLPTFASPVDGFGPGRILDVTADRAFATVRFDSGAEQRVEPWDVTLAEEAGR